MPVTGVCYGRKVPVVPRKRLLRSALQVAALLLQSSGALALSPDLRLTQFYHTAWTSKDGAPTNVESLAQTSDGYLWMGAAGGLFRFDGVRFERIDSIGGQRLLSNDVYTLFARPGGGLWIGYRFGGASLVHDGKVTNYGERSGLPGGSVTRFAQDHSGVMWATTTWGLMRLQGSLWQNVNQEQNLPSEYVKTLRVARDGALWIVIGHEVMVRRRGEPVFIAAGIQTSDGEIDFVEAPDGTLWLTDAQLGARAVDIPGGAVPTHGNDWIPLRHSSQEPIAGRLIDRDGTMWTASAAGIYRVKDIAQLHDARSAPSGLHDRFSDVDGLTAPYALSFLEDREGTVWIGTSGGLDRFRESRLTPVDLPRGGNGFAIAAGASGSLIVAIESDVGVFQVTPPSTATAMTGPQNVSAAYRSDDGIIWLGGRGMLWRSGPGASHGESQWMALRVPVDPAHPDFYPVQAITRDGSGRLWVSVVRGGTLRFDQGKWTRIGDPPLSLATGADGRVWLGYPKNKLQVRDARGDGVREFSAGEGLDLGNVLAIHAGAKDAWVGGELGLAYFDGQRLHAVTRSGGLPFPTVTGILATAEGDLWLGTSEGVMKVAAAEVKRVTVDPRHAVRIDDLFNFLDGTPGTPNAMRPLPSIVAGTDGRLWFTGSKGIAWLDPKRVKRNTLPPGVAMQSIVADGKEYAPQAGLRLPIRTRDLQISYTALSLSIPERVRFRYQLHAGEPWRDAGTRRAAYFTDLAPGDYTFRVAASNNDGVWNETGASFSFTIPPAFYQTRWFYALCAFAFVAMLTIAYRVRVRQVAAQVRGRLEARLAERERIARELHDTLLQGMQGLIWRFQAATERIPSSEPARQLMEQSLDRADQLLGESRDRVKDLRPAAGDVADLAQALAAEGEQFAKLHTTNFRVSVQGGSRALHPIVREEAFLIGREAMANAFVHASAADIEAEVTYGDAALQLRIRDDGQGISAAVLDTGKPGHFGLVGMRERAKKLGAHLEVWSKPGAGTEIDLRVPADVAYRRSGARPRGIRSWPGATS
jgi:signal transduction histidine kinase/ligand-binding sensor domain-containing protein